MTTFFAPPRLLKASEDLLAPSQNITWVRGVNIGGWLMLERFITPYQFAITDCHLKGDFCWYPGALSAPSLDSEDYRLCDFYKCKPVRHENVFGQLDYPLDEYTLASAFDDKEVGAKWLNYHFENFVSYEDVQELANHGVTHVRVPLPHWILGNIEADEPWIAADRWKYFVRFCRWCREVGIEVWPDIHTAPGSQNGFDNSGQQKDVVSCYGWSHNKTHVERSLQVLRDVTAQVARDGLGDVVTGFGLLNEPFKDCDKKVYFQFINDGLNIVRGTLGNHMSIYVSDMFLAKEFNNGQWSWLGLDGSAAYKNTYLDSHYYHVFAEEPRALSPRQHIAYVCTNEYRDTISCCYADYNMKTKPAPAVKRMVGEWSAAYDILPVAMLKYVMDGIANDFIAPYFDRELTKERKMFLQHFVEAQMVAYEAAEVGTSGAWFYWTLKMEGGAFAEWDFLRGLREKWIPHLPSPNVTSESVYGTCYDIIFRTDDSMEIIHEYPDPATLPKNNWQGVDIDDDIVVTHGESLLHGGQHNPIKPIHHRPVWLTWALWLTAVSFVAALARFTLRRRRKAQYSPISDHEISV